MIMMKSKHKGKPIKIPTKAKDNLQPYSSVVTPDLYIENKKKEQIRTVIKIVTVLNIRINRFGASFGLNWKKIQGEKRQRAIRK